MRGARARPSSTRASWPRAGRSSSRSCSARWQRCVDQLPALERVAARHRDVKFRIVAVRADAAQARSLGSNLPVGYDHDGAVANEYAVVVCPTITYVARGGRVAGLDGRPAAEAAIEPWVRALVSERAADRRRCVEPRIADELPGLGLRVVRVRRRGRRAAALAAGAARAAARAVGPRAAARTRSRCAAARSRTPTGRCSGTLGLEPDEQRIPVEALMLERLKRGAYRSRGVLADALRVATLETRGRRVGGRRGPLRGRAAASALSGGRVVVADAAGVIARLFSEPPPR